MLASRQGCTGQETHNNCSKRNYKHNIQRSINRQKPILYGEELIPDDTSLHYGEPALRDFYLDKGRRKRKGQGISKTGTNLDIPCTPNGNKISP